jgi:hypothetical protein
MSSILSTTGCGDGRVVATAAKKFKARGVGVDIDPDRIKESHQTLKKFGVERMVEIRQGDALKVKDLENATVIMLYMLPEFMEKLEPQALKALKPGKGAQTRHAHRRPRLPVPELEGGPGRRVQGPRTRAHPLHVDGAREVTSRPRGEPGASATGSPRGPAKKAGGLAAKE